MFYGSAAATIVLGVGWERFDGMSERFLGVDDSAVESFFLHFSNTHRMYV